MDPIKRKRVTQVGSGAFSVYLPKRWIDDWLPEQREAREVDLHRINQSLLIVPVLQDRSEAGKVPPEREAILRRLRSAYVRGRTHVRLQPLGPRFDNDCVSAARDALRRLDERLVSVVGSQEIGFDLRPLPAAFRDGADLLEQMATRLREVVDLLAECVDSYGTDPDRALHTARLVTSIHDEDVVRLYLQSLRLVATLELPLGSVTDFQVLDLTADGYHGLGQQAVRAVGSILASYGMGLHDLAYPRADLVRRLGRIGAQPPVAREMVQGYRRSFADLREALAAFAFALSKRDGEALVHVAGLARLAHERMQERIFETALRHWGEDSGPDAAKAASTAYQVSQPLANLLEGVAAMAQRAAVLIPGDEDAKTMGAGGA